MALFMKQEFSPPLLSRRWIAIKLRPNVLIHSRDHIISILESGLLFREDSIEVEREVPPAEAVWRAAGGGAGGWLTRGEALMAAASFLSCAITFPPRSLNRFTLAHTTALLSIPLTVRLAHRRLSRGTSLRDLLLVMRDYLALARRSAACLKEYSAVYKELDSIKLTLESLSTILRRQQSELGVLMSRASSSLLGNTPWLRADVAWEVVEGDQGELMKIHHAFLVIQSTLLKHIAMAHYVPSAHAQRIYKNHNERLYWIHNVLIKYLSHEFKENYEALDRMYRLLKNYGTKENETKKLGLPIQDGWHFSEVHSGVARASLEIKMAQNKCTSLDMFLDACSMNKQEINMEILNKDIEDLIDGLTNCLKTVQGSQLRLKKIQYKLGHKKESNLAGEQNGVLLTDDRRENAGNLTCDRARTPELKDEVFYFLKTEDDDIQKDVASDLTTAPGEKERETTKVVLSELKRKLVKREDVMRERERQALVNTMPELKNNLPEFPRQINLNEMAEKTGYLTKLKKQRGKKNRLFKVYKISPIKRRKVLNKNISLKTKSCNEEIKIDSNNIETKIGLKSATKIPMSMTAERKKITLTKWRKCQKVTAPDNDFDSSGMSDGLSDVESNSINKVINETINSNITTNNSANEARNIRFTKKELLLSPSSSESDIENFSNERKGQIHLLDDVRRHRVARKKNYPSKRGSFSAEMDESLRPMEYNFGTGMALASVLQVNSKSRIPNLASEEVFIGDGEVSEDSGNDEDN